MNHIKSRKHTVRATALATATLAATLSLPTLAQTDPQAADAQSTPAPHDHDGHHRRGEHRDNHHDGATDLDQVDVHGLRSFVVSPKFTQTVQDTPQTVQIISKELFTQQGATTLTEALRNTPGVGTFYAGENGSSNTGDAVYMRGYDSSSSIFVDGVRDLGNVSRDLFNIEQVEVVKGPASTDTGRSAPTGAINMVSKEANLQGRTSGTLSVGTESQRRATADTDFVLGDTTALRLNGMWQDSDVPGRDQVNNKRWGIAPSLGFGLGTDTRVFLDLYYVKQNNVPDGFVPTIGLPGWTPEPGLEQLAGHPVDSSNFYGSSADHDDSTSQMATLRFEHDFSDSLKLSNNLRWGEIDQNYLLTSFMTTGDISNTGNSQAGNIKYTDPNDLSTYTLVRTLPNTKDQINKILTDQLNLRWDFSTGAVDHFITTGAEVTREEQTAYSIGTSGSLPPISLYHPDTLDRGTLTWYRNGAVANGRTDTAALYLFDTLKFGDHYLLTAGVRGDHYTTDYDSTVICGGTGRNVVACPTGVATGSVIPNPIGKLSDSDTLISYKLGFVYKPVEELSLYANAAQSQQPPGGASFALNTTANSADSIDNDPQKAKTYEVGSKWAFNKSFELDLSLFQTNVENQIIADPTTASGYAQTGKQRVQGVEVSTTGNITENWNLILGYTHQNTSVQKGSAVTADGSDTLSYTPKQAFTSWTTYKFPFGLTVGGGIRYTGGLHRGTDNVLNNTPEFTKSWTVYDAVVSYDVSDNFDLRLNGYNLFDKDYVASINKSGFRYTPGTPRYVQLSMDFKF